MSNKSGASDQIISLPKGGGAQSGMGEKFSPDLFTGTGNLTIPIPLPSGRNGFQPEISLVYSTGNGNGPFGLGWNLSIPGVTRKTSKGVPVFDDSKDVFVLSGAEDLVPVNVNGNRTQYRPRTEGLYAIIERVLDADNDYWEVKSKDGLISIYGTPDSKGADPGPDPAVIYDPEAPDNISSWKLTETRDPFGNRIVYSYERDLQQTENRHWNELYLSNIRYVDYQDAGGNERFLINIRFEYEDRPDPFSTFRSGFEVRTTRRCARIVVETVTKTDVLKSKVFELQYTESPLNRVSLLSEIQAIGYDGAETQSLPPVSFKYTEFDIEQRDFFPVQGDELPLNSLASSDTELVDLFGNGLPDIIQMNGTIRYWRNLGQGRFDIPRLMKNSPGGLTLEDPDVQMLDANGEGKADLMVNQVGLSGYYPLKITGEWDRRSFQKYDVSPSFSLQDPEVRLFDLDGDGVTDALRTSARFECFFQDADEGWNRTLRVERKQIETFPDVSFSDPRVKLADLAGDGLQDIVLVYDGNIEYWPYMGHGKWGKRIHMANSPRLPHGYDPKRILIGDVDGDGLADIVYADHCKVLLWINQGGNSWSDPIEIDGTPPVSDADAVRLIDLLGSGVKGVLWSADATNLSRNHMYFLDFTGGAKPYLLHEMDNNIGAITRVGYKPSTDYYLADQENRNTQWKTNLPFPTQVVSKVEIIDALSGGKLTTEYHYHHGYWDGVEREFRGFGRVDQYDTESFSEYNTAGLHGEGEAFLPVDAKFFSPPTLTKHWFHQGPLGETFGDWYEADYSDEYWIGDPQKLERPPAMNTFLNGLERRVKRDALRTLRGRSLRTELYALDGSEREDRPYTVTEHLHGVREDFPPDPAVEPERKRVFFPHLLAQRSTQWERGNDPMTTFTFTEDYDEFGQPRKETRIACPRGWKELADNATEPFLATRSVTEYASPVDPTVYIRNRVAMTTEYEVVNDGSLPLLQLKATPGGSAALAIIGQQLHFYDGPAFTGRDFGEVGSRGALVRTETLVLTEDILHDAYRSGDAILPTPEIPPYLDTAGPPPWSAEYPQDFRDQTPALAGYTFQPGGAGSAFVRGYFSATVRRSYDFHTDPGGRGMVRIIRDPLGNDTTIQYDDNDGYLLLPSRVTDANGLETRATYDYRVLQPKQVTDPNGNRTVYGYTPLGLLKHTAVMGKEGEAVGDWLRETERGPEYEPSTILQYDFLAFAEREQPISVRTTRREHHINDPLDDESERNTTVETVEYSDGFGRLLQTRARAEDVIFGDPVFGNQVLPTDQEDQEGTLRPVVGRQRESEDPVNVVVSGWQRYDNKGQVIEKYEPFYARGWQYDPPSDDQLGQKVVMFYDPRGQVIRTLSPDGSEQRVIYGVPNKLADPTSFTPTPWEVYTYDPNDNAGRTHPGESDVYTHCHDTPSSAIVDALGRTIETVERNRTRQPDGAWSPIEIYRTRSTYDIRGNLLTVKDALGRLAFRHVYDLTDNPLRIDSIDAGIRRTIVDAAGNEIERRDSKGALILQGYDELNRPTRLWARDGEDQPVTLREKIIYGDSTEPGTPENPKAGNLLGRPYKHYDEAGLLIFEEYDFKGNLKEKARQVIKDQALANDWTADWNAPNAEDDLDDIIYQTATRYDALNRPEKIIYPEEARNPNNPDIPGHRAILEASYNRAGALESVTLDGNPYVTQIAYNARGQRVLIAYGNGIMTRYAYDEHTFRLVRLRTERYQRPLPNTHTYRPNGRLLQDFAYTYDLVGNILQIIDRTPGCGVWENPWANQIEDPILRNQVIRGDALVRNFEYDAIYRLISATGREDKKIPSPRPWSDDPRAGFGSGNHGTPNQDNAPHLTSVYWERYDYDPVGNMLTLKHGGNGTSWTRHFGMGGLTPEQWNETWRNHFGADDWLDPLSNQLTHVGDNAPTTPQTHLFDANGNLKQESTNRHFAWDHADRLKAFRNQPEGSGHVSVEARYLYGADGMRVKKWVRKNGTGPESTVYIDEIFEHHWWRKNGEEKQNNHLHIMDDRQRIAILRRGDIYPGDAGPDVQYHLGDHLGSSTIVANGGGEWINREENFPYGETSFGSFAKKRYRFSGKERDEESGFYYHGARFYSPSMARWLSCDPKHQVSRNKWDLQVQQINLYSYVDNSPLTYFDPSGTQKKIGEMVSQTVRIIKCLVKTEKASKALEEGDPQKATVLLARGILDLIPKEIVHPMMRLVLTVGKFYGGVLAQEMEGRGSRQAISRQAGEIAGTMMLKLATGGSVLVVEGGAALAELGLPEMARKNLLEAFRRGPGPFFAAFMWQAREGTRIYGELIGEGILLQTEAMGKAVQSWNNIFERIFKSAYESLEAFDRYLRTFEYHEYRVSKEELNKWFPNRFGEIGLH